MQGYTEIYRCGDLWKDQDTLSVFYLYVHLSLLLVWFLEESERGCGSYILYIHTLPIILVHNFSAQVSSESSHSIVPHTATRSIFPLW